MRRGLEIGPSSSRSGFNKILNLNADNTFGIAYISEMIPLMASQRAYNLMLYLGNDTRLLTTLPKLYRELAVTELRRSRQRPRDRSPGRTRRQR